MDEGRKLRKRKIEVLIYLERQSICREIACRNRQDDRRDPVAGTDGFKQVQTVTASMRNCFGMFSRI